MKASGFTIWENLAKQIGITNHLNVILKRGWGNKKQKKLECLTKASLFSLV